MDIAYASRGTAYQRCEGWSGDPDHMEGIRHTILCATRNFAVSFLGILRRNRWCRRRHAGPLALTPAPQCLIGLLVCTEIH